MCLAWKSWKADWLSFWEFTWPIQFLLIWTWAIDLNCNFPHNMAFSSALSWLDYPLESCSCPSLSNHHPSWKNIKIWVNCFSGMSQCPSGPPVVLYVSAKNGLPAEEITWAKMLQTYGYRTAAVGTWHMNQ